MVADLRAERRQLLLMRVSFLVTVTVMLGFAVWVMPWVPVGMRAGEFGLDAAIGVLLGAATAVVTPAFLVLWSAMLRNESLPEFLRLLFGAHRLILSREQFLSRLTAECGRARRNRRYVFSVLTIEHPVDREAPRLSMEPEEGHVALRVRTTVRSEDVVATAASTQVWVLLRSANAQAAQSVVGRLADELRGLDCRIGAATFGVDGERPNALLLAALERLAPIDAGSQPCAA